MSYSKDDGGDKKGTVRWSFETGGSVICSPTVADGIVYVGSKDQKLYAVDTTSGSEEWSFETGDWVRPSPTVVDGMVYVGSHDCNLYALDAVSGTEEWFFEAGGDIVSLTVVDGIIYVGSHGCNLYALDAATGTEEWSFETSGNVWQLMVVDGVIFVAGSDNNLYAVDAATGTQKWAFEIKNWIGSPTVVDEIVYIGGGDNSLYAVDAATGTKEWSFETGGWIRPSPTVADGTVYVGSDDNSLYAVDASKGTGEWAFKTGGKVRSSPTVVDGTVYVGNTEDNLYALDAATGSKEWYFEAGGKVRSSPTVVDGTVYVDSRDNNLYALDAATGSEEWCFRTGDWVGSPTVVDETVYVGSQDNNIYAIAASDIEPEDDDEDDTEEDIVFEFRGTAPEELSPGRFYRGSVDGYANFGVFVNIGESVTGLLHRSELDTRLDNLELEPGDTVFVKVQNIQENGKVDLGWSTRQEESQFSETLVDGPKADTEFLTADEEDNGDADDEEEPTEEDDEDDTNDQTFDESDDIRGDTRPQSTQHSVTDTSNGSVVADSSVPDLETVESPPQQPVDYTDLEDSQRPIGAGGNADVSKATLSTPDGDLSVAVKKPRMAGTLQMNSIDRMLQEAETWQKLDDHDHIVGIVDYGSEPLPWIAMEYMDAGHLGERASEMAFEQALWTAIATTKGILHAHQRGVAHLDLKPENILFRSVDGAWDVPKVADWGLSKHLLEHSNSVEGMSVEYAAPEQFDDERGQVDQITDIYQLGAVFYEVFTGQPPFQGQPFEVMKKVETEEPTPPSDLAGVPSTIDDILLRALAKEKNQRYESVLLLRNDLQEQLGHHW